MRIEINENVLGLKTGILAYKHPETKLEKGMEFYSRDIDTIAVVYQNGKFAGAHEFRYSAKLDKKNFKGLKTSLFKKEIDAELYFIRPSTYIRVDIDDYFDAAGKKVHFIGEVEAQLAISDAQKYVDFIRAFSGDKTGPLFGRADMAGFIIGAAAQDMITSKTARIFRYEPNQNGGRTHDAYMGKLAFDVYFKKEKINRYKSIGLTADSIKVDPKEFLY